MIKCDFCGKEFKTQPGVYAHYKYCKERCRILGKDFYIPFQKKDGSLPGRGCNKGLTKETDSRVRRASETRHQSYLDKKWIPKNLGVRSMKPIDNEGYIAYYMPEHPLARSNGLVFEHTLVAERLLGRYLLKEEIVHHKDKNRKNNEDSNIIVFSSKSEHTKFHQHGCNEGLLVKQANGSYTCRDM